MIQFPILRIMSTYVHVPRWPKMHLFFYGSAHFDKNLAEKESFGYAMKKEKNETKIYIATNQLSTYHYHMCLCVFILLCRRISTLVFSLKQSFSLRATWYFLFFVVSHRQEKKNTKEQNGAQKANGFVGCISNSTKKVSCLLFIILTSYYICYFCSGNRCALLSLFVQHMKAYFDLLKNMQILPFDSRSNAIKRVSQNACHKTEEKKTRLSQRKYKQTMIL